MIKTSHDLLQYVSWAHAAIELTVILAAAAAPQSIVAEYVLSFLLPNKDPSQIFLSPMCFLATAMTVTGAAIRVQCFREMGKYFTFSVTLLKDHKLITSGPYSYVRHPSYTGAFLNATGLVIWYTAQGSWVRESEAYKIPLAWLILAPVIALIFLPILLGLRRIPAEDEILRKAFGTEWDEWVRKVPNRIIPGIY